MGKSGRGGRGGRGGGRRGGGRGGFGGGRDGKRGGKKEKDTLEEDVFEVDDDRGESVNALKRYDDVDVYEYELDVENMEDEEIDEDEAFNEEDYEKYGDVGRKTKSNAGASDEEDESDEDDSDDDEGDDNKYQNLSDLLDATPNDTDSSKRKKIIDEDSNDEDDEDDEDEDEDDEDEDEEKHKRLLSVVDELNPRKKRRKTDKAELTTESEFNLLPSAEKELGLEDLMDTIQDDKEYTGVKRKLKALQSFSDKAVVTPLSKVERERITRQVGYKQTAKDVSKYQRIVKKNREAETLQFPLYEPKMINVTSNSLTQKFEPQTNLEKTVSAILRESGIEEDEIKRYEALQFNRLDPEEVKQRQAELARMKNLLFYKEEKAKRQKKIKSKAYRKIKKKEREKKRLEEEQRAMEADSEFAYERRKKAELDRATERMTLKHSAHNKFLRNSKAKGLTNNTETRRAIQEQLELSSQLRQKMNSAYGSDESDFDDDESEDENQVQEVPEEQESEEIQFPKKGLFAMKFMQRAIEKQNADQDDYEEMEKQAEEEEESDEVVGIRKFHAKPGEEIPEHTESTPSSRTKTRLSGPVTVQNIFSKPSSTKQLFEVEQFPEMAPELPVLNTKSTSAKQPSTEPTKEKKAKKSKKAEKEAEDLFVSEDQTDNPWLQKPEPKKKNAKQSKAESKQAGIIDVTVAGAEPEDDDGEVLTVAESTENEVVRKPKFNLFASANKEQEELIRQAFAGDDSVETEFGKEKQEIADEDAGIVVPDDSKPVLPGWGSWAGDGVVAKKPSRRQQQLEKKKKAELQQKRENAKNQRKDAGLSNVIINEKRDKRAAKYLIKQLPYPYVSAEQYERDQRNPIGKEWNTTEIFNKLIKPAVIVKPGANIEPMKPIIKAPTKPNDSKNKTQQKPKNLQAFRSVKTKA